MSAGLLVVAATGLLAGVVNAVAGAGTLISFPGLLAAGLSPLTANVTNTVGMVPGYLGSTAAYRGELRGSARQLQPLSAWTGVGALVGAGLLLATSARLFETLVPFLVLAAAVVMATQPLIVRWMRANRPDRARGRAPFVVAFLAGAYGAYFGAALGVILLAALGILLPDGVQELNAKKSILSLVANSVGAAVLAVFAHVAWTAAGVLAVTALIGGWSGGRLARRLPAGVLRSVVVAAAVGAAIYLFAR
ncbi:MAG: hypothetical protein JWM93_86 [Frankiales bacterium]|nr:hypothetical protein [Frankiales bacterium]